MAFFVQSGVPGEPTALESGPGLAEESLSVWDRYWWHAKRFDAELERDWDSDLDVLLVVVSPALPFTPSISPSYKIGARHLSLEFVSTST